MRSMVWDDDATTNTKSEDYHHNLSYEDIETSGVSIDIVLKGLGQRSAIIQMERIPLQQMIPLSL